MAIEVKCPHCRQVLEAEEEMCGMTAECPNCGGAMTIPKPAAAPPRPVSQPLPRPANHRTAPPPPPPPADGNVLALLSLIFGIIGFFTMGLTALLAVIFGHMGRAKARQGAPGDGMAKAGLTLGYVVIGLYGLIFCGFLLLGVVASGGRAIDQGEANAACISQMKSFYAGLRMYANDFDECYPPASGAEGLRLLIRERFAKPERFVCPGSATPVAADAESFTEANSDFEYYGGLTEDSPQEAPVLRTKPGRLGDATLVLRLDGSVEHE
ncbi:MAG: DUF4190 domain-containing protein [Lentisphaeria bacterium]|jgi:hypothetical protein|nr:DUF4190 domain-containing protein [Lentisphaeria bacterium]